MGKKRKHMVEESTENSENVEEVPAVRSSDEPAPKKSRWVNKERVLIFSSRGISFRDRHLMLDLRKMMPHSKSDSKMDRKDKLFVINEICEMKNCQKCIFFESRKKMDLYMWLANTPRGPSAKFLVENVHTMLEMKMTGNSLRGSRPMLAFDKNFDSEPHWALLKEMFTQTFGTPRFHPKSQPFVDHVLSFSVADNRVWIRNYQILEENAEMAEIGPRFVLNPIRIFSGSFGGATLYENPHFVSPNLRRREALVAKGRKYAGRVSQKRARDARRGGVTHTSDPTDVVFETH